MGGQTVGQAMKRLEEGKDMALKRPVEKQWDFKTPPAVFPQTPGVNWVLLGPFWHGENHNSHLNPPGALPQVLPLIHH